VEVCGGSGGGGGGASKHGVIVTAVCVCVCVCVWYAQKIQRAALLMALVRTAALIRKLQKERECVWCTTAGFCTCHRSRCVACARNRSGGSIDVSNLENKLRWDGGTDAKDQEISAMHEADHVKSMMTTSLDVTRVEARLAHKVSCCKHACASSDPTVLVLSYRVCRRRPW